MPALQARTGLLKHSRADLHTEGNHFIDWQPCALRVFAASFAVRCLKLAERVFTIGGKMALNPLNPRHLAADRDNFVPDVIELLRGEGWKCPCQDVPRHSKNSLSECGACEGVCDSLLQRSALAVRPYALRLTAERS